MEKLIFEDGSLTEIINENKLKIQQLLKVKCDTRTRTQ